MNLLQFLIMFIVVYCCVYAIINRICKCIEHCATTKSFSKVCDGKRLHEQTISINTTEPEESGYAE